MTSVPLPSPARRRVVLAALLLATVLASLDSSFVPIAFPDMIDRLDTSTSVVVWVALGYLISATGLMLLSSRFAALWGADRVFQIGTLIYALAMSACAFVPDVETLIALRVVQGTGMALFLPTTFSMAAELYPREQRGKALGIMQSGNAFGFVLGPIFAGWLLDAYDWRALFGTRIPLAALAVAGSLLVTDARFRVRAARVPWDLAGAALLTFSIFALLFGLNRLPVEDNHREPLVWLVTATGFVAVWLFVRQEHRARAPLIDLTLFAGNREFTRAALAFTAFFAAMPAQLFVLPLVLIGGLELRAWDVGLVMAVTAVITVVASPHAGKIADRFGAARLAVIGAIVTVCGYLTLLTVQSDHGPLELVPAMVLIGAGSALFFTPNNTVMMSAVPPQALVTVAGLIGVLRQSGYAAGFAIVASLVTAIQDNLEELWTAASVAPLGRTTAEDLAWLFEEGGIWSPEVLLFALRVSSLLAMLILCVTIVASWPQLALRGRGVAIATGTALTVTAGAMLLAAAGSGIPLSFADASAAAGTSASTAVGVSSEVRLAPVAPFGFASRAIEGRRSGTAGGAELYALHCSGCHGADGRGIPSLGVALAGSAWVDRTAEPALARFLEAGRLPGQPDNRTGRVMPGFPDLPPEEHAALARFVKGQNFQTIQ